MKKVIGVLLTVFLLVFCSNAFAVDLAGKFGLTGKGGIGIPLGSFANLQKIGGQIGYGLGIDGEYFVTNRIAAGAYFDYSRFKIESGTAEFKAFLRITSFGAFFKYVFPTNSDLNPYLRLSLGLYKPTACAKSDDVSSSTSYDIKSGYAFGGGIFKTSDFTMAGIEVLFHKAFVKEGKASFEGNTYKFGYDLEYLEVSLSVTLLFGGK